MKAVLLQSPHNIFITDVPEPIRAQGHVLIQVKSAGICGSDIGAFRGINPLVTYPRIIGHEVCGLVIEIGANSKFNLGDQVMLEPYIYCGNCYPCSIGHTNCCENLSVLGVHQDGGMKEIISHPEHLTHQVSSQKIEIIPWDILPMAEPLVISMFGINIAHVKAKEHVLIFGCGQIGLLAALYALTLGAKPIIIDPLKERLNRAISMGISHTIHLGVDDPFVKIQEITQNRMAEVVIEASGHPSAIRNSLDYASFAGRIVFIGWPKNEIALPTALITKKGLSIFGSRNSADQFPESIELIRSKKVDVAQLITKIITLEQVPQMIQQLSDFPEENIKVLVTLE